ncbi:hypothetical protein FT663_04217 [Candidozyma haemuli var. vulneris]|uniref:Rgp1-domain-containing protein n=1 Tax=Candidozyma haemuli TaxID=45357 RepID=A0A2V1ASP1_9ASCO|nr:hypothetical protein CXQ85_004323 [[Candida] haemuloni]KAF3987990.1 hypothetical protein FT663_04217 [[Candida] haemuloni var. vulneris]KAF3991785.1 hypothetical protein FT662_01539 [[Candida] haemuloni var. vulneris]PVH20815.1 hypothetical protein CXQ85_004323 [[Candida] haemuloni]
MPSISPLGSRLSKDALNGYHVAVTYKDLPQEPDFFECHIEFSSTQEEPTANGTASNGTKEDEKRDSGWLSGFFSSEKTHLVDSPKETSLLLGYIQLIGYIRLNGLIGSDGSANAANNPYWKNPEYLELYGNDDLELQIETIKKTPFLKANAGEEAAKNRTGGVSDLNLHSYDARAQYLVHDLVYPFNTLTGVPENAENHADDLAKEVGHSIVPFYVTAQSLLFSSSKVKHGESEKYILKVQKPPNNLPPSYNTKSTGAAGDAGLVSIGYSLVVGASEESNGQLSPRNIYFPFEFRSGKKGWDREWLQHDYLQEPFVDKAWKAELRDENVLSQPQPKGSKEKLLRDIDTLIESDVQVVAANERRKSSVSKSLTEYKGLISQLPAKLRVSYQIRVNSIGLCTLTMSKPFYHVGDEVHFFLDIDRQNDDGARIVGFHAHVEAHEIFNLEEKKQFVNTYKVTPTVKQNLFATALAANWDDTADNLHVSSIINLPRHISQQFQSSKFMDLRYFFVCKFLLNEFAKPESSDDSMKSYADYIQTYKVDNEGTEFKFAIPLVVLP